MVDHIYICSILQLFDEGTLIGELQQFPRAFNILLRESIDDFLGNVFEIFSGQG